MTGTAGTTGTGQPPGTSAPGPGEMGVLSPSPVGVVVPLPHGRRIIDGTGTEGNDDGRLNSGNRSLAMSRRRLRDPRVSRTEGYLGDRVEKKRGGNTHASSKL